MKRILLLLCSCIVVFSSAGCDDSASSLSAASGNSVPVRSATQYEVDIAYIGGSDNLTRTADVINRLDTLFPEKAPQIARLTVSWSERLQRLGIKQNMLPVVEAIEKERVNAPSSNAKYSDCIAAYYSERSTGSIHERAMKAVHQILNPLDVS